MTIWKDCSLRYRDRVRAKIRRLLSEEGSRTAHVLAMRISLDCTLVSAALEEMKSMDIVFCRRTDGGVIVWSVK